jgi:hypothetical protein
MWRVIAVSFPVLLATASPLAAQGRENIIAPGARLRVWPRGAARPTIGTLQEVDSVALSVVTPGGELLLPRDSIVRVELSQGMHSDAMHGLGIGAVIGGGAGAAFGLLLGQATEDQDVSSAELAVAGAGAGGILGGLVGLGIGALTRSERWHEISLGEQPMQMSVLQRPDGRVVLGVAMKF